MSYAILRRLAHALCASNHLISSERATPASPLDDSIFFAISLDRTFGSGEQEHSFN
jgi:hypothetical protein